MSVPLWVSDDGQYAVVWGVDVPPGVARGGNRTISFRGTLERALNAAKNDVHLLVSGHDRGPSSASDSLCLVYTKDLMGPVTVRLKPVVNGTFQMTATGPKRVIPHYPHKCPFCGGKAYVGGGPKDIDCETKCQSQ